MGWFERKPAHEEQINAAIKVWGNLCEKTMSGEAGAPFVLDFQLPDSKFRYGVLCIATVQMACAPLMTNPDAVLNELLHTLVKAVVLNPGFMGSPPGTPQELANRAGEHVEDYLHRWATYIDVARGGNSDAATSIICSMLHSTETDAPPTDQDARRLRPLALWIEGRLDAMATAFATMP